MAMPEEGPTDIGLLSQEISHETMYDAIESAVGIRPDVRKYQVLDDQMFEKFARDQGETIGIENIAGFNIERAITIRSGYEDSALHEFIHSAGFMPEGIHPGINEGMTQALTKDLAEQLGIVARSGYTDEVRYVNDVVIPLTGKDRRTVFSEYALAPNKQKYLAESIWERHGHRFSDLEDWGEGVRERFMRQAANALRGDVYLDYLVEINALGKSKADLKIDKVVEKRRNGKLIRIIYITP
jgi:hypothetical protein